VREPCRALTIIIKGRAREVREPYRALTIIIKGRAREVREPYRALTINIRAVQFPRIFLFPSYL